MNYLKIMINFNLQNYQIKYGSNTRKQGKKKILKLNFTLIINNFKLNNKNNKMLINKKFNKDNVI